MGKFYSFFRARKFSPKDWEGLIEKGLGAGRGFGSFWLFGTHNPLVGSYLRYIFFLCLTLPEPLVPGMCVVFLNSTIRPGTIQ